VKKYDLSTLRAVFVAGERSDPSTLHWIENILKDYNIPAIDHWWQTELAFPGAGNALGLGKIEPRYGACAAPVVSFCTGVSSFLLHTNVMLNNL
jgi:propionyl-CoA synthetase